MYSLANIDGVKVCQTKMIGCSWYVFDAWTAEHGHSSLGHVDGVYSGRLGSERLPRELDALPACTDERYSAVMAWVRKREWNAYAVILRAIPFLTCYEHYKMQYGSIDVWGEL